MPTYLRNVTMETKNNYRVSLISRTLSGRKKPRKIKVFRLLLLDYGLIPQHSTDRVLLILSNSEEARSNLAAQVTLTPMGVTLKKTNSEHTYWRNERTSHAYFHCAKYTNGT